MKEQNKFFKDSFELCIRLLFFFDIYLLELTVTNKWKEDAIKFANI